MMKVEDSDLPSLKLTAKAPENGWLEYDPFLLGFQPNFQGLLPLVSGRIIFSKIKTSVIFPPRDVR